MRKPTFQIFNIPASSAGRQYPISPYLLISLSLIFLFFAFLQWSPTFADPDSFFHTKVAILMNQEGLIKSFPWLQFAPFTQNFTDQHFLYHLFLTPFVTLFPPLLGVKIASVLLALAVLVFFYFFLKRWGIRWPLFYLLLLLSIPPFVFRLNLAKAGPLAIVLLFIALSLIWQKRYWALGILSFFYVWTHGGWSLIILLAACAIIADLIISKKQDIKDIKYWILNIKYPISNIQYLDWKLLKSILIGLSTGLIFNPYFPHNLRFYWEQVVQIGLVNYQDIVAVGMEWYPTKLLDFIASNAFGLMLALAAFAVFFWRMQKQSGSADKNLLVPPSGILASQILSASAAPQNGCPLLTKEEAINCPLLAKSLPRIYCGEGVGGGFQKILTLYLFSGLLAVMTLKSQRYIEYFAPFFILANAFLLDFSLPTDFSPGQSLKKFFKKNLVNKIIVIYLLTAWLIFFAGKGWELRQNLTQQFNWNYLRGASEWLKNNTPDRSLVFHANWSDFPLLFYHNAHNVYIAGMDPTFFYRYDRELYKEWIKIGRGEEPFLAERIKQDFGTNFILVKPAEKLLMERVEKKADFVLRYEDKEARVFEIK